MISEKHVLQSLYTEVAMNTNGVFQKHNSAKILEKYYNHTPKYVAKVFISDPLTVQSAFSNFCGKKREEISAAQVG